MLQHDVGCQAQLLGFQMSFSSFGAVADLDGAGLRRGEGAGWERGCAIGQNQGRVHLPRGDHGLFWPCPSA